MLVSLTVLCFTVSGLRAAEKSWEDDTVLISPQGDQTIVRCHLGNDSKRRGIHAWEPNTKDLDAAVNSGDFAKYFARIDANKPFLAWVLHDSRIMDLHLEGAAPMRDKQRELNTYAIDIATIEHWQKLYASNLPVGWLSRYKHYEAAYKSRQLLPSFDNLPAWDYGKVLDSWASDKELAWGREMVRTWRPDLLEKEQIPLIVSEVWQRFSPFPFSEGFPTVLAGGDQLDFPTRGLWRITQAMHIRLAKGEQTLTLTRPDSHRGVALRWIELKSKN